MLATPKPVYRSPPPRPKTRADMKNMQEGNDQLKIESKKVIDMKSVSLSMIIPEYIQTKSSLSSLEAGGGKSGAPLESNGEDDAAYELMEIMSTAPQILNTSSVSSQSSLEVPTALNDQPVSPICRTGNPLPDNSLFERSKRILKRGLKVQVKIIDAFFDGPFSANDVDNSKFF